ncbi:chemotaxis protein CheB [Stakelama marina]|uniref:chemotaxis protein CheB n=1 Tax=Stakelama marina TaxID=2826939 RepID=UPI0024C2AF94|nr:chemotaxis protein CheB [Stakelama marina]
MLIVDDSMVARTVLTRMVSATHGFTVAAAVADARAALDFLAVNTVEVILLDIEMPGVDGLTALPDLVRVGNGAKILIVSSSCDTGGASMVQALALGAADTLVKPGMGNFAGKFSRVLEERLGRLVGPAEIAEPTDVPAKINDAPVHDFDIVAIGASTGGIHALTKLLRAVPDDCDVPILVTQHLPASFMSYFATQLALLANRPCEVARDHTRILPGRIIIAPGNAHLRCTRMSDGTSIRLNAQAAVSGCMPSVDPMLESVAEIYGERALAVVLSGMGRDGSVGAAAIRHAGGAVVVQDQASSVVWGMPGTIASRGDASAILPPEEIGALIAHRRRPA